MERKKSPLSNYYLGAAIIFLITGCQSHTETDALKVITKAPKPDFDEQSKIILLPQDVQKNLNLQIAQVQLRPLNLQVETLGEVLPNANTVTRVHSPVGGRVVDVLVQVGQKVKAGEKLASIRSSDVQQSEAELLQSEAQINGELKRDLLQIDYELNQARTHLKLSESAFTRNKQLLEEGIAAPAQFEQARTEYESDQNMIVGLQAKRQATLDLAKQRLFVATEPIKQKLRLIGVTDLAIARLLKTRDIDPVIYAFVPRTGVVIERNVNPEELIEPNTTLFSVGDFSTVWLKAIFTKRTCLIFILDNK